MSFDPVARSTGYLASLGVGWCTAPLLVASLNALPALAKPELGTALQATPHALHIIQLAASRVVVAAMSEVSLAQK